MLTFACSEFLFSLLKKYLSTFPSQVMVLGVRTAKWASELVTLVSIWGPAFPFGQVLGGTIPVVVPGV